MFFEFCVCLLVTPRVKLLPPPNLHQQLIYKALQEGMLCAVDSGATIYGWMLWHVCADLVEWKGDD